MPRSFLSTIANKKRWNIRASDKMSSVWSVFNNFGNTDMSRKTRLKLYAYISYWSQYYHILMFYAFFVVFLCFSVVFCFYVFVDWSCMVRCVLCLILYLLAMIRCGWIQCYRCAYTFSFVLKGFFFISSTLASV